MREGLDTQKNESSFINLFVTSLFYSRILPVVPFMTSSSCTLTLLPVQKKVENTTRGKNKVPLQMPRAPTKALASVRAMAQKGT